MYLASKPVRHKHGIKQSISHKCPSHILNSYCWKNLEHLSNMKWPFFCFVSCSPVSQLPKNQPTTLPTPKSNKINALSQLLHATHLTNVIPCQNQLLFVFPTRSKKKYEELDIICDARFRFTKNAQQPFRRNWCLGGVSCFIGLGCLRWTGSMTMRSFCWSKYIGWHKIIRKIWNHVICIHIVLWRFFHPNSLIQQ